MGGRPEVRPVVVNPAGNGGPSVANDFAEWATRHAAVTEPQRPLHAVENGQRVGFAAGEVGEELAGFAFGEFGRVSGAMKENGAATPEYKVIGNRLGIPVPESGPTKWVEEPWRSGRCGNNRGRLIGQARPS